MFFCRVVSILLLFGFVRLITCIVVLFVRVRFTGLLVHRFTGLTDLSVLPSSIYCHFIVFCFVRFNCFNRVLLVIRVSINYVY